MTEAAQQSRITRTARIAGVWYVVLAVCGGLAEFFVRQRPTVPGDAGATADNILANAGTFRLGIGAALLGQVVFVLLVFALFDLVKVVNRRRAVLMVALVLVAATITCLNMVNQFGALIMLEGVAPIGAIDPAARDALAMLCLDLHHVGYLIVAQVFCSLRLIPLGLLIWRSGFIPRIVGGLLVVAGAGYLAGVLLAILAPGFGLVLSEVTFVGELRRVLWLLIRGVHAKAWLKTSRAQGALTDGVPADAAAS